jgi:selenium-binding protein 1
MHRREFLSTAAAAALLPGLMAQRAWGQPAEAECCDTLYATPADAMRAPREELIYVTAVYAGTRDDRPDYLATIDVRPDSPTRGQVIHRLAMPTPGDELHHFGWNTCSSCFGQAGRHRQYLIVPGLATSRIHVVDVSDPFRPRMHKVIDGEEVRRKTDLSAPHTVHCTPDGRVMISMLGDAQGRGPGGFLLLDEEFRIAGRWERHTGGMHFNYDFWYQPRHGVMLSSEWAAPNTVAGGFKLEDVQAGRYGHRLHFWDWERRVIQQTIDLGAAGMIPLEVRFFHNPDSTHGFVGAALSSTMWHYYKEAGRWHAEKVIEVAPVEHRDWPFPVPGLITDLLISLDDRWLYFSNWLHGDVRQYDISDPSRPRLAGQAGIGGVLGRGEKVAGRNLPGGPQMLQLSRDGKRLYVTNSLYSVWDNQFYPAIQQQGSYLLQIDCDTERGGLQPNPDVLVDFGREPHGPARAHEMRFPGGDCTSDIWV